MMVKMLGDEIVDTPNFTMVQLQDIVETICAKALERAWPPIPHHKEKPELEELLQDPAFVRRFKVGLARETAALLAANDSRVCSIYLLEALDSLSVRLDPSLNSTPNIHLLILVEQRSAALQALTTSLDLALVREVRKFPASGLIELKSLINPLVITEKEVAQHKGYGMLLASARQPLLTIWKRNED